MGGIKNGWACGWEVAIDFRYAITSPVRGVTAAMHPYSVGHAYFRTKSGVARF
jgi:hypothetical protein